MRDRASSCCRTPVVCLGNTPQTTEVRKYGVHDSKTGLASASTTWQGSTSQASFPLSVRLPDTMLKLICLDSLVSTHRPLLPRHILTALHVRMGNLLSSWFRRSTKISPERQHELDEMRQQLPGLLPRRISKRYRLEERSPRWLVYDGPPSESSFDNVALPPPVVLSGRRRDYGMLNTAESFGQQL